MSYKTFHEGVRAIARSGEAIVRRGDEYVEVPYSKVVKESAEAWAAWRRDMLLIYNPIAKPQYQFKHWPLERNHATQ